MNSQQIEKLHQQIRHYLEKFRRSSDLQFTYGVPENYIYSKLGITIRCTENGYRIVG